MPEGPYYLFDPVQFKEYGGSFFQGADFYYRYQQTKKLFFRNIYIPFGPVCQTKKGFESFLKHLQSLRLAKIKIDLPMIYDKEIIEETTEGLHKRGFKKVPYLLQDEETLLVFKNDLKLDNKKRNIINHGYKFVDIVVKDKLSQKEIDNIYQIYLGSGKRIGFSPKSKDLFLKFAENCLVSLAFEKETHTLEGYVFGYLINNGKILLNMFTGTNDAGREHKIGHAMHYELFKTSFEKYGVDFVDLRGASRTKNRAYIHFKRDFSHNFYSLPGSFTKFNF
ncbi:MAG: hypothetical protein NT026_02625 [Candidatus Staskawiczbacteria bacterium]|nr:hypothetical protein [Candidatus Staskawiczbacteria bacterium]